jgi:hypothetical protein
MLRTRTFILSVAFVSLLRADVDSPKVLRKGQPDSSDLQALAAAIYEDAGARTDRQRAEAIWRFFLTDGRFVAPGYWYHIAGWAYEEPLGEVLDPIKLLNSYGFGLCYQIAPVLEAVWKAGGFEDARVWFLTGHTVAEVFYEGAYHYFDSDMMGYTTVGQGGIAGLPVASVHEIEGNGDLILCKLAGPNRVLPGTVPDPWYPADVRASAIGDLASLFTSSADNWLFPMERAPRAHSMNFVLRPGERLIRNFWPEQGPLYYLPYKFVKGRWEEFPQEIAQYAIRTADGPRSQKDARLWATGRIEYRPIENADLGPVYSVHSPYVIIDAQFRFDAELPSAKETLAIETSSDEGRTWVTAATLTGPHHGTWTAEPAVLTTSKHGRRTAVSGWYAYQVRLTRTPGVKLRDVLFTTRFQLNPRTLPELTAGNNELVYRRGEGLLRSPVPLDGPSLGQVPHVSNAHYIESGGQGYWAPDTEDPAEFLFRLEGNQSDGLAGLDAGGRFLDLSAGWAPDKLTAEIRKVAPIPAASPSASIEWSAQPDGPFHLMWQYNPRLSWRDGVAIDRTLRWPEVDKSVEFAPTPQAYVRYRIQGMALDSFRLARRFRQNTTRSPLVVIHQWTENGVAKSSSRTIPAGQAQARYAIEIPKGATVRNTAIVFECKAEAR